jgi:hypothetical protein
VRRTQTVGRPVLDSSKGRRAHKRRLLGGSGWDQAPVADRVAAHGTAAVPRLDGRPARSQLGVRVRSHQQLVRERINRVPAARYSEVPITICDAWVDIMSILTTNPVGSAIVLLLFAYFALPMTFYLRNRGVGFVGSARADPHQGTDPWTLTFKIRNRGRGNREIEVLRGLRFWFLWKRYPQRSGSVAKI